MNLMYPPIVLPVMEFADTQLESTASQLSVARPLHPEDITVGDHVALSQVAYQYPSFCWFGADLAVVSAERPVRMTYLPLGNHDAMKIASLCLPFVLCELSDGTHVVHDTRQVELVRLNTEFAASVRNAMRDDDSTRKKKRKRKRKRKRVR